MRVANFVLFTVLSSSTGIDIFTRFQLSPLNRCISIVALGATTNVEYLQQLGLLDAHGWECGRGGQGIQKADLLASGKSIETTIEQPEALLYSCSRPCVANQANIGPLSITLATALFALFHKSPLVLRNSSKTEALYPALPTMHVSRPSPCCVCTASSWALVQRLLSKPDPQARQQVQRMDTCRPTTPCRNNCSSSRIIHTHDHVCIRHPQKPFVRQLRTPGSLPPRSRSYLRGCDAGSGTTRAIAARLGRVDHSPAIEACKDRGGEGGHQDGGGAGQGLEGSGERCGDGDGQVRRDLYDCSVDRR